MTASTTAEQAALFGQPTPDFNDIVEDMVARYAAHKIRITNDAPTGRSAFAASCSCGWRSGTTSSDLRPEWAAIDEHLIVDVLPDWPRGVCWCGRAILLGPLGKWFHAQADMCGHYATPAKTPDGRP